MGNYNVKVWVKRAYTDTILKRKVAIGESLEVDKERALLLLSMNLVNLLSITNLSFRENAKITSKKRKGKVGSK
jgi:hypothetical protein